MALGLHLRGEGSLQMGRMSGALVVAGILLAGVASAATVLRFDSDDLTERAAVIVHGKVTHKTARKSKAGDILTDLRIEVTELVKGARGKTFSFSVYGGVLGNRGSAISGAPTFQVGEEILLFLDKTNKQGLRTAIGLSQGKYTIRVVEGTKLAFRDLEGLQYFDPKNRDTKHAKPEQGRDFAELLKSVKQCLVKLEAERRKNK